MLSLFEAALLERHLRRCPSCRAFAASAMQQTQLLRGAALEQLPHPVAIPSRPARTRRRSAVGALGVCLTAAAAAIVFVAPSSRQTPAAAAASLAPALIVFAANPAPGSRTEVPRLSVDPASVHDHP